MIWHAQSSNIREFTIHDAAREDALERIGNYSEANASCVIPTRGRRFYDGILSISRCDHYAANFK